ncbi:raffinose/stachyose/melibiose transport system permease protein [Microbacterium terrae]|uniref:L-arabinose transport system permease protein AraQ n=1 Tax=Microbacterium terrae TaxID=69369 RepID=A0A0M2HIA7_9MICO|nr:carbohydrate ABC transporter permease [Microbacterium terrae]KJL44525.1 L-arabinose transport system permease protein AraQ [Microbacterium terrae]MBP1079472.1 raffinose/stachyose/melibiose transport system permease protein [Microbacterium terrae]GLJ96813.1 sugar ABC transporter permease [Microbacterium terrae]
MKKYTWRTGVLEVGTILVAVLFLIPIYILVNLSFKAPGDQSSTFALPQEPTFQNYIDAWAQGGLGNALINSAIVTGAIVLFTVIFAAAAAYPLSRLGARWSKLTYLVFLAGLLLPAQLALLPLYQTVRDLGLLGTLAGVIIVGVGASMPFSIFLYAGFMRALPAEYEEAAALDGAHAFRTFWSVVFPLVRPITGTIIILTAVANWNDFLTPLLYLSGSNQKTITVAIYGFVGQYGAQWNLIFAGIIISILPILIAYFFLQKYIVQGFAGGLKG